MIYSKYTKSGKIAVSLVAILITLAICVSAVSAGEKLYTSGPDIIVTVSGSNVISPGQEITLPILIQNKGLIDMKLVQSQYMTTDYLPTTAKGGVISLASGDSPIAVRSGSQIFGDLLSGHTATANFKVYIPENAQSGTYEMLSILTFEYLYDTRQSGTDLLAYQFKEVTAEIPVTVIVKPSVVLEITNITSVDLNAGGVGHIYMDVTNVGTDTANSLAIFMEPAGSSPISPIENGVFVGTLAPHETVNLGYKVGISSNADPTQKSPVVFYGTYKDYESLSQTTASVTVGIDFDGKVQFKIVSDPPAVTYGENTISVVYRNTGEATAYQAQGKISVMAPFSSSDTNAYLGDIEPNGEKTAVYKVKVSSDAAIKEYSINSEIRYSDIKDNDYTSDTVKIIVKVQDQTQNYMIIGIIAIIVIVGVGYFIYRKKQDQSKSH